MWGQGLGVAGDISEHGQMDQWGVSEKQPVVFRSVGKNRTVRGQLAPGPQSLTVRSEAKEAGADPGE